MDPQPQLSYLGLVVISQLSGRTIEELKAQLLVRIANLEAELEALRAIIEGL